MTQRRWSTRLVATVLGILAASMAVSMFGLTSVGLAWTSARVPCSGADGGAAGLVAAVNAANAAGGGTINLAAGCTYSLTSANNMTAGGNGLPVISTPITINGGGATIAGNRSSFRIILIGGSPTASLTLNRVIVTGGNTAGPAGGIANIGGGTLTLNRSLVTGNTSGQGGGGIVSGTMGTGPAGVMILNNSEVSFNTVTSPPGMGGGGGILNHAGTLTLNSSIVDHNTSQGGGGIASGTGTGNAGGGSLVTLNRSVISGNTATGGPLGGGGGMSNGGTLVSNYSLVSGNTAPGSDGGGILNHANATLNETVVVGNRALDDSSGDTGAGAGIGNVNFGVPGAPPPTLLLNDSIVAVNSVSADGGGGGIANIAFGAPTGTVTLNHTHVNFNKPDNCFPTGSIAGCIG
jgi:hypothetical protein